MILAMSLMCAAIAQPASAANKNKNSKSWVGRKVVLKDPNTPLKVGKDIVAADDVFRVYVVRQEKSPWLWVTSRMVTGFVVPDAVNGVAGWVKQDEVVALERGDRLLYQLD